MLFASSLSGSPLNGATGSTVQPSLYRPNFNQSFQRTGTTPHPYPGSALFPAPPFGSASMMPNGNYKVVLLLHKHITYYT